MAYVERLQKLHFYQYGFRVGFESGMLINNVRKYFYGQPLLNNYCGALVTDMTNAFGSSDVDIIISDMKDFFSVRALKMLRSFLARSTIRVETNGEKSAEYHSSDRGFGQGSSFSAQLYLILMRKSHVDSPKYQQHSFADDATGISKSSTKSGLLEGLELARAAFVGFCEKYNMTINTKKTFVYLFGKPWGDTDDIQLQIYGNRLRIEDSMTLLGIRLHKDLQFTPHVNEIASVFRRKLSLICQFKDITNTKTAVTLIQAYLHGKFNYANGYLPYYKDAEYLRMQNLHPDGASMWKVDVKLNVAPVPKNNYRKTAYS